MADHLPTVVLFGYESSTFTLKVRLVLKLKQIPYSFITVPSMMPRQVLRDAFHLTYRKIPVLAIGREIYCDTSLICEALEHFFPRSEGYPTIYPVADDGNNYRPLIRGFASYWTDRPLFRVTTGLIPASVWRTSFGQDRAALIGHRLDADKLEKKLPENLSRLDMQLSMLEPLFEDRAKPWVLPTASPSLADVSIWYQLKWGGDISKGGDLVKNLTNGGTSEITDSGIGSVFSTERYPALSAWYTRFEQYLDNLPTTEVKDPGIDELISQMKAAPALGKRSLLLPTPRSTQAELDERCGLKQGALVSIAPDDTGRDDPTIGALVALSPEEVIITPRRLNGDASVDVRVHFPRLGFVVRPVDQSKLLLYRSAPLPRVIQPHDNLPDLAGDKMKLLPALFLALPLALINGFDLDVLNTPVSVANADNNASMGGVQSTPQPLAHRPSRRLQPAPDATPSYTSQDEKLAAVRAERCLSGDSHNVLDKSSTSVSVAKAQQYVQELLKDSKNRLGLSALSTNNMNVVLERPATVIKDGQYFNLAIPHEGLPVTNQRSSGRCWIFAATNVFRIAIMQKYNIEKFELSQSYLFYWDKVEKANYFLEQVLALADQKDASNRLISELNKAPVNDGGQWDMLVNLVSKYGIVPQTLYPDTWNAKNSASMGRLITTKLREAGLRLHELKKSSTSDSVFAYKESVMRDVIRILTLTLGPPPPADEKFTWEFYDKSKGLKTVSMTPMEFAGTTDVQKYFSLVNDPRHEYMRLLTVSNLGNVSNGRPVTYVNLAPDQLKEACVAMLRKGMPVWFGSDVGKQSDSSKGIMDTELVDYELGFNVTLGMSKAERLITGESSMTHAMVLTAVHLDKNGKPVRWRVENSWSEEAGTDGYFVMSDRWMDEYFYQAVVDPSLVSQAVKDVLKQEPKVLPLWDPMGALA